MIRTSGQRPHATNVWATNSQSVAQPDNISAIPVANSFSKRHNSWLAPTIFQAWEPFPLFPYLIICYMCVYRRTLARAFFLWTASVNLSTCIYIRSYTYIWFVCQNYIRTHLHIQHLNTYMLNSNTYAHNKRESMAARTALERHSRLWCVKRIAPLVPEIVCNLLYVCVCARAHMCVDA